MMKMESKKSRPRWWDSLFGPKNSSSKWVQDNLDEMNQNVRRMLKLIEDSDADSFAKKVEMYYQRRQELINLVEKSYRIHCSLVERYNHATGGLLKNIPNSDLIRSQGPGISISNVSSGKSSTIPSPPPLPPFNSGSTQKPRGLGVLDVRSLMPSTTPSPPPLPKFPSSKQLNGHSKGGLQNLQSQERAISYVGSNKPSNIPSPLPLTTLGSGSKQLKRLVSVKQSNYHNRGKICKRSAPTPGFKLMRIYMYGSESESESEDSIPCFSDTESDDDDGEELQHEGTDELEAELRDMIEKLYIQLEEDRVVSKLQGGILRYEDNTCDYDREFREVKESVSSNVNKALLEENLELQDEITRLWKEISYLKEYNNEANEGCQSLEEALSQPTAERIEAETLRASEVEQLKVSIVKKNNNVEELNKILEAVSLKYEMVVAERDQLKARVAMLDADPKS